MKTPYKAVADFEEGFKKKPELKCVVDTDDLKAEAIKWIKWFKDSDWDEFKEFNSSDEFGSGHEGLDNWIRHFFNLTKEELSK